MAEPTKLPKIKFSNDLLSCLTTMDHANDYIAFMMLAMLDEESGVFNGLKITNVDVSDKDFCFYTKTQDGKLPNNGDLTKGANNGPTTNQQNTNTTPGKTPSVAP